ncbi:MAG: hypothetical protein J6I96_02485 [Oscillospiraceae bacterium]|nr:hypothetical protein [Oscillospiraceae bacterium]
MDRKFLCAVLLMTALSGCSRIIEDVPPVDDNSANSRFDTVIDNSRYVFSTFTEKEQEYYELVKKAAENGEHGVIFPEKLEPEELKKLFMAVYYQEEHIFWLASYFEKPAAASDRLRLFYRFEDRDLDAMRKEVRERVEEIFEKIDDDATDYEKMRVFHDEIVLGCTFGDDEESARTLYGALVDGQAQCVGYSKAFDYLCSLADINCMTVMGYNTTGATHSWNIAELDGKWYHVDCTWDDPILDPPDTEFDRHYYFLANDSDILGVTHMLDERYYTWPACQAEDNYYTREGLMLSVATDAENVLSKQAVRKLSEDRKCIEVRFDDKRSYDVANTLLFETGGMKNVLRYANAHSDKKVLETTYVRYLNPDEFIIHVEMIYAKET